MGGVAALYCVATEGRPVPTVQWYKGDTAVTPIASLYQQIFIAPTDTPHTMNYTCIGKNYAGNREHMNSTTITVIVESKQLYIYINHTCAYLYIVACDQLLDTPKNGKRFLTNTNGFIKRISFDCNPNYAINGSSLATCNNGTWSSAAPTCIEQ